MTWVIVLIGVVAYGFIGLSVGTFIWVKFDKPRQRKKWGFLHPHVSPDSIIPALFWPIAVVAYSIYRVGRKFVQLVSSQLEKEEEDGHREAAESNRGGAAETGITFAYSLTSRESPSVEPELVVGPLVAYRVWAIGYGGTLRSTGVGGLWKPDEGYRRATCHNERNHAVPDWNCGCGFWCFKEPWDAIEQGGVVGSLLIQGRCIETTKGYRAEQAKITALCRLAGDSIDEGWWEGAEELYDVSILTSIKKFIEYAEAARE